MVWWYIYNLEWFIRSKTSGFVHTLAVFLKYIQKIYKRQKLDGKSVFQNWTSSEVQAAVSCLFEIKTFDLNVNFSVFLNISMQN